jgi:hypothetical protein
MSWDFGVKVDTGGDEPAQLTGKNMTYNLNSMLTAALGIPFRELDNAPCSEAAGVINKAIHKMKVDPEFFKTFNPPNGWGTYEGCLSNLEWLLKCCIDHPKASIYVH